ncbi:MAG TPA: hypothetical protein VLE44_02010 [Candidatus Saccharimonadales bacterium]|nr:hypothetical protein [Candidatus Saccharimonadales bacterium]
MKTEHKELLSGVRADLRRLNTVSPGGLRVYIANLQNLGPISNKDKTQIDPITQNFEELTNMKEMLKSSRLNENDIEFLISVIHGYMEFNPRKTM